MRRITRTSAPITSLTGTGVSAYMFGSEVAGDYWAERYFLDRVLENYKGSVYLIQGMHDWNVDPHMAVPTINRLIDAGIEAGACLASGITITPTALCNLTTVRTSAAEAARPSRNDTLRLDARHAGMV